MWLRRDRGHRNPNVDNAVDKAKANLEFVRDIANRANERAAAAQAEIAALMKRMESHG